MLYGIDTFLLKKSHIIKSAPFGLVCTQYAQTCHNEGVVDHLIDLNLNLKFIVEPVFGFLFMENEKKINSYNNVPVYDIYSDELKKNLKNINNLIFDIQGIGIKDSYYFKMLFHLMKMLNNTDINLYVLDRPNPLNATIVSGMIGNLSSYNIPLRYGLTIAELGIYFNKEFFPFVNYTPVPMEGYIRDSFFKKPENPLIKIYPGIHTVDALYLYPGIYLLKGTNLSLGEGLQFENQVIGAPWLDNTELLDRIIYLYMEGFKLETCEFIPEKGDYKGQNCRGIKFEVEDFNFFNPIELFIEVIQICYNINSEFCFTKNINDCYIIDNIFSDIRIRKAIEKDIPVTNVYFKGMNTLEKYLIKRKECLIY
ncbi:MAG: exo-beta-N-acetylmuramidase NamZ domain-containing protein [Candidatus Muiribacteriota bacterium]